MATTNNTPKKYPNIYMQWSTARKVAAYREEGQEPTAEQVQQWQEMDARRTADAAGKPEPVVAESVAEVTAAEWSERDLAADSARLELLANYHGPATAQQEAALPDWHALSTAANFKATEAAQAQVRTAAGPVTPENQAKVTALALAGRLSDQKRKELKWLGFEVPAYVVKREVAKWSPPAAPAPEPADLEQLHAGAHGPATGAQVYELAVASPLRQAYDHTPNTGGASKYATIYAAGRSWRVSGNAWERWAGMSDRSAANSGRRAKLEAERTEKKNKALADKVAKDGPLAALFYGTPEPAKPRYTTAEEAKAHEMKRRQEGHDHHRNHRATDIRRIRQKLAAMSEAEVAHFYTTWQRRPGGYGLEYILDAMHQLEKAKAKAQQLVAEQPKPAQVPAPAAGPQQSQPAAAGWHVIDRPAQVAPEHVAQLEQLRELVVAMPINTPAPTLFQVVQLAEQIPTGAPYWAEARRDGLAIVYGTAHSCAEVLRLAPSDQWPVAYTNYTPTARHPQAQLLPAPYRASNIPPSGAPRRVQIGRSWYTVHRPPLVAKK